MRMYVCMCIYIYIYTYIHIHVFQFQFRFGTLNQQDGCSKKSHTCLHLHTSRKNKNTSSAQAVQAGKKRVSVHARMHEHTCKNEK